MGERHMSTQQEADDLEHIADLIRDPRPDKRVRVPQILIDVLRDRFYCGHELDLSSYHQDRELEWTMEVCCYGWRSEWEVRFEVVPSPRPPSDRLVPAYLRRPPKGNEINGASCLLSAMAGIMEEAHRRVRRGDGPRYPAPQLTEEQVCEIERQREMEERIHQAIRRKREENESLAGQGLYWLMHRGAGPRPWESES